MDKTVRFLFGLGLSLLIIGMGFNVVNISETLFEKIIGFSNIFLFSGLTLWAFFKIIKNALKKVK
ncbi:hypothetical protein [Mesonia maritima]|uniref:Uncharacterized protein n=1 Tax=Mesonia maritima TaxID=1793873 RepID=A0ABU1K8R0_9FLAO|nr:hypothetical protein [Mesonia maritima]MDR6301437.1 hypothetical protein [Mesonia maritima]